MLTKTDLSQIRSVVRSEIQAEIEPMKKDIKNLKSNVGKIKKTVDVTARLLDTEQMRQRKRVEKIETHLGLASA